MEIVEEVKEHKVIVYTFLFGKGLGMTVDVDLDAGDTIQELPDRYTIHIVGKKGFIEAASIGEEDIEVFKSGLVSLRRAVGTRRLPTEEELFDMRAYIKAKSEYIN